MALDYTPGGLGLETRAADQHTEDITRQLDDRIRKYHGVGYFSDVPATMQTQSEYDPENTAGEYMGLMLPRAAFAPPRYNVSTTRTHQMWIDRAKGIQFGLNRWVRDTRMIDLQRKLFVDWALLYCVVLTLPAREKGISEPDDPRNWPSCRRISPRDHIFDPQAGDPQLERFRGIRLYRDHEDLMRMAEENSESGWNAEALQFLGASSKGPRKGYSDTMRYDVDREQLEYYEVHAPEAEAKDFAEYLDGDVGKYTPENGYNGMIFTVPVHGHDDPNRMNRYDWVRAPRPYFGPRWGPIIRSGAYYCPDQGHAISPLGQVQAQSNHLNVIAIAMQEACENYKRLLAARDPDILEKIVSAKHDWALELDVEDMQREVATLEMGGPTDQLNRSLELARDTRDRATGIHDSMRGNVTGGTATEVAVAANEAGDRLGYQVAVFQDDVLGGIGRTVGWYLDADDVEYELSEEETKEVAPGIPYGTKVKWRGGLERKESQDEMVLGEARAGAEGKPYRPKKKVPFDRESFDFEVMYASTARETEAIKTQKAAEVQGIIAFVAQVAPLSPWWDWATWLEEEGHRLGRPELARMLNPQILAEIQQQAAQAGPWAPSQEPQPRVSRDTGAGSRRITPQFQVAGGGPPRQDALGQGRLAGRSAGAQASSPAGGNSQARSAGAQPAVSAAG